MELAEASDHFQPPTEACVIARARDNVRSLLEFNRQHNASEYTSGGMEAIQTVGIVGGGMMGAAIAAASAQCGLRVTVVDSSEDALVRLPEQVDAVLVAGGSCAEPQSRKDLARLIRAGKNIEMVVGCDLVIESVTEDRFVKQPLIAELVSKLGETEVLASNTSTISIAKLSANLTARDRFCGVHFLRPVHQRPLLEIVRGPDTSASTVATAVAYADAIRKIPLVVNDSPGFMINRLVLPYAAEAMGLLMEGATIETVERTAVEFGMALGPFALLDEVGLDTALDCGWVFAGAYPDTLPNTPLLVAMVKAGRLGRKTGAGFFAYEDRSADAKPVPDPAVDQIIARWADAKQRYTRETIAKRLFMPMLLEATRALQEKTVVDPRLLDLGAVYGLGFPESRGGLLYWGDNVGAAQIVEMLGPLEHLGARMRPTPLLLHLAESGRRFYGTDD